MKTDYEVGDRVIGLDNNIENRGYVNQIGTIVEINVPLHGKYYYKVEYDFNGARIWSNVRPLSLLEKALYEED